MLDSSYRSASVGAIAIVCVALTACTSLSSAGSKVSAAVTPYKMDVIQGNVVTREQLALVKPGMPKLQVRDILGSALLSSVFHADRWDYVFTLKRPGAPAQSRKVTVFFQNDLLERVDADELPSESEFVSTLKAEPKSGPLPALEASDEGLKKFPTAAQPSPSAAPAAPTVAPMNYPPLEPSGK